MKNVTNSLMRLCRLGILEVGCDGVELTYRITPEFGETLKKCNQIILLEGGYNGDPLGMIAALALIEWCGSLERNEAHRLANVLTGVLRSYTT